MSIVTIAVMFLVLGAGAIQTIDAANRQDSSGLLVGFALLAFGVLMYVGLA